MELGDQLNMVETCGTTVAESQKVCILDRGSIRGASLSVETMAYLPYDVERCAVACKRLTKKHSSQRYGKLFGFQVRLLSMAQVCAERVMEDYEKRRQRHCTSSVAIGATLTIAPPKGWTNEEEHICMLRSTMWFGVDGGSR